MTDRVTPCLWFNDNAEEAVNFYVSLVPGSLVIDVDPQLNVLYLHVLGVPHDEGHRIDEVRRTVLRTEARIVRAIGSREDVARVSEPLGENAGVLR